MVDLEAAVRPRRSKRAQFIGMGVILAAALVATVSFLRAGGARDGSGAIDRVMTAAEPALAHHRQQAESGGGSFSVSWSSSPMAGGHMVKATVRSSIPTLAGRAVFMVDSVSGEVIPQDRFAASLLAADAVPMPHG